MPLMHVICGVVPVPIKSTDNAYEYFPNIFPKR